MKETDCRTLTTPYGEKIGEIPWNEYPRPQMKRDSFLCLNGRWDLVVEGPEKNEDLGTILVPFPPESLLSGLSRKTGRDETLVYSRTFSLPEGFDRGRVFLHFGAADQKAEVYLNGTLLASHDGGYLPFSADATGHLLDGENRLTVRVRDPMDETEGLGKQREKRGGIWYTPFSGLWQTVWAESVPETYIRKIRLTPWYDKVTVTVLVEGAGEEIEKTLRIRTEFGEDTVTFRGASYEYVPKFPHPWTPEDPYLYEMSVEIPGDRVGSYFGLRSVTIGTPSEGLHAKIARMFLNGAPTFYHGVLDQGYYSDGIVLPGSPQGYLDDIRKMKEMGFNTLRKHIKIEPELFYYY
ncbi:MAG: glycoside hydrolase family 2, partial [Clostridia bacterium]|nr:glycoside hydrolase family 2 [Clostridia bacterium]